MRPRDPKYDMNRIVPAGASAPPLPRASRSKRRDGRCAAVGELVRRMRFARGRWRRSSPAGIRRGDRGERASSGPASPSTRASASETLPTNSVVSVAWSRMR